MNKCNKCGCEYEGNFCSNCGAKKEDKKELLIFCPKCNSSNIQMQVKRKKGLIILGCVLLFGGIGLMFLGIGAILGAIVGLIIGAIINAFMPDQYETIAVCQICGNAFTPVYPAVANHPNASNSTDSNLVIVRNDDVKGTIVSIKIQIDKLPPFIINNNDVFNFNVEKGFHQISYEQANGIGKNRNKGQFSLEINEKKNVVFSFTR